MDSTHKSHPPTSFDMNEHATPSDYTLLPGEQIRSITEHPLRVHSERASTVKELLRLTRATHTNEIGKTGPSIASLALEIDTPIIHGSSEHLHLYEVVFGRDSLRVAIDLFNARRTPGYGI